MLVWCLCELCECRAWIVSVLKRRAWRSCFQQLLRENGEPRPNAEQDVDVL